MLRWNSFAAYQPEIFKFILKLKTASGIYLEVVDEIETRDLIGRNFFVVQKRTIAGCFGNGIRVVSTAKSRQRVAVATRSHDATMLHHFKVTIRYSFIKFVSKRHDLSRKSSYLANE